MEPRFQDYMYPILSLMKDGMQRTNTQIREAVLVSMNLNKENLVLRQQNGNLRYVDNINFAISYLTMAFLLEAKKRGVHVITESGINLLKDEKIKSIDEKLLRKISPEFKERVSGGKKKESLDIDKTNDEDSNPTDKIYKSFELYKETVKSDLLANVLAYTEDDPYAFEQIANDLMLKMGYGFDNFESGHVTKKSGDGGIDSIIFSDKLGLEKIYVQAKRYDPKNSVGSPEVQQFKGSIGNSKGVFITTSYFSKPAIAFVNDKSNSNIVLIDGDKLTELMYEFGIGLQSKVTTIDIKELDTDYFNK